MKSLFKAIVLGSALIATASSIAKTEDHSKEYDFLVGSWSCEWVQFSENKKVAAYPCEWEGKYTLDGTMMQDDFRMYANDKLVFAGTTLRTFVPHKNRWDLAFLASNMGHWPNFYGNWTGDEMAITSQGEDKGGKYDAKIRFHQIEKDSFTWEMKKTYDQGETWEIGSRIYAKRTEG